MKFAKCLMEQMNIKNLHKIFHNIDFMFFEWYNINAYNKDGD